MVAILPDIEYVKRKYDLEDPEYHEEKLKLLHHIISKYYFNNPMVTNLELHFDNYCTLRCKYCYLVKPDLRKYNTGYSYERDYPRAKVVIDNMIDYFKIIDIYGEELTVKPLYYDVVDYIKEVCYERDIKRKIVTPTNMSFLYYPKLIQKMEELINKHRKNCSLVLSASVDGKYCDIARPRIDGNRYADDFYEKMFRFQSKFGFGYHPMIAPENIEYWKKNFDWFISNMKKYNIPLKSLFLLEVRNPHWTYEKLKYFVDFINHIFKRLFDILKDKEKIVNFMIDDGFNLLKPSYFTKGISCFLQSAFNINVSRMSSYLCHRLTYPIFKIAEFDIEGNDLYLLDGNVDILHATITYNYRNSPYCSLCGARYSCLGTCLGSNYEYSGDIFTPHPNVCRMEIVKSMAIACNLFKYKLIDLLADYVQPAVIQNYYLLYDMVKNLKREDRCTLPLEID